MTITVPGWLSKLPRDWTVEKAGYRINMSVGGTPPTSQPELFDGEVPWLTIADMDSQVITDCEKRISEEGRIIAGASWANPGDLLYSFKLSIGKTAFVGAPLVTNEAIATIRRSSKIDLGYARWMLPLAFDANASTNIYGAKLLNQEQLRSARMPVPPSGQQRLIADFLDRETAEIDAFIAEQNRLIDLTAEKRAATIDEVLLRTTTERIALKHLGVLSTGLTLGATYSEPTETYPYIRVANVQANRLDLSTVTTVTLPAPVAARVRLFPGDVLMTEGGDRDKLGRGALWSGEIPGALHQNHVFAFRCGPLLLPEFLVYALEATEARSYFEATASQSTNLASTNSTLVKRFKVPRIAPQDQRQLVATLDRELDVLSEAADDASQLIALAQERRAALISAAVTGQIDVTERRQPAVEQLQDEIEETR